MNTSTPSPLPYGKPPPLTLPYLAAVILLSVVGILLNTALLTLIAISRKLRTIRSVFTVFLALSDLCVCLTVLPLTSHALPTGLPQHPPSDMECSVAGCTYIFFRWTSLMAVSLISVEKCLAIRAPLQYHKMLTAGQLTVIITCTLIAVILLALLPITDVGQYKYEPASGLCTPVYINNLALSLILLMGAAGGAFAITLISYGAMAEVALRTAKRGQAVCDENNCSYVVSRKAEMKPVQTLCIITGVYAMCWVPYTGVHLCTLASRVHPNHDITRLIECLLVLFSTTNPAIYTFLNRALRSSALALAAKIHGNCGHNTTNAMPERTARNMQVTLSKQQTDATIDPA